MSLATMHRRRMNEVLRNELHDHDDGTAVAFFCECRDEHCGRPLWLTIPQYDLARAGHDAALLLDRHRADTDDGSSDAWFRDDAVA